MRKCLIVMALNYQASSEDACPASKLYTVCSLIHYPVLLKETCCCCCSSSARRWSFCVRHGKTASLSESRQAVETAIEIFLRHEISRASRCVIQLLVGILDPNLFDHRSDEHNRRLFWFFGSDPTFCHLVRSRWPVTSLPFPPLRPPIPDTVSHLPDGPTSGHPRNHFHLLYHPLSGRLFFHDPDAKADYYQLRDRHSSQAHATTHCDANRCSSS